MSSSRLASEELYRLVFERTCPADSPDWDSLNEHYENRLGYLIYEPTVCPVYPLSALMYDVRDVVVRIYVAKVWPHEVWSEDPSTQCFSDPFLCD